MQWLAQVPEPQRVGPTWTEGSPGLGALRPQANLVSGGAIPDTATSGHTSSPCLTSSTGSTDRKRGTHTLSQPHAQGGGQGPEPSPAPHFTERKCKGWGQDECQVWGLSGQADLFSGPEIPLGCEGGRKAREGKSSGSGATQGLSKPSWPAASREKRSLSLTKQGVPASMNADLKGHHGLQKAGPGLTAQQATKPRSPASEPGFSKAHALRSPGSWDGQPARAHGLLSDLQSRLLTSQPLRRAAS